MRYLVPATILAACFSFAAYAEDSQVEEAAVESEITIVDQEMDGQEGEAEEVAALTAPTGEEEALKAKKK